MKSKAPLALMEQLIMLLVFALAAAFCLRAFLWADHRSAQNAARDQAALQAQCAAETLKHHHGRFEQAAATLGGSWDGSCWTLGYDETWQLTDDPPVYILSVHPMESGHPHLGQARLEASDSNEISLFQLTVCWQEVSGLEP